MNRTILLFCVILFLGACTAIPEPSSSPLATPTVSLSSSRSAGQTGTVKGKLLRGDQPTAPIKGAVLYLAEVAKTSDGKALMVKLDKSTAPKVETDEAGEFVFRDVPANDYGLVLDLMISVIALRDPVSGEDLLIEVVADGVHDFGQLVYQDLPALPYAESQ
jgi:hypothetical protein